MIRLILIATILILYLIIGIPVLLIEWVIGKFNPRARDISSLRMVQAAFKLMLWITGSDITYIGHENVPKDQAVLYVGNHCSYFDILLTYSMCPDLTGYVAKAEMLKVPLLRDWMKRLYCLFLDRSNVKEGLKTILTGIEYIKKGISICIFPEGTRSKDGNMIPFKEGSMKIASKTGRNFPKKTRSFLGPMPSIKFRKCWISINRRIDYENRSSCRRHQYRT